MERPGSKGIHQGKKKPCWIARGSLPSQVANGKWMGLCSMKRKTGVKPRGRTCRRCSPPEKFWHSNPHFAQEAQGILNAVVTCNYLLLQIIVVNIATTTKEDWKVGYKNPFYFCYLCCLFNPLPFKSHSAWKLKLSWLLCFLFLDCFLSLRSKQD